MYTLKLSRANFDISIANLLFPVYFLIATNLISRYFLWDFTVWLGLALAPFICSLTGEKRSIRYFIPAVFSAGFALMVSVNTTLFLALLFVVLLLIENLYGKVSLTLLFLILLVSPIFKYISQFISFPIRFWLSEVVATILSGGGLQAHASGNIIEMNGYDFSVDQACAGLNMLSTSFIICLFIIAFYQKKTGQQLSLLKVIAYLTLTLTLNIGCNLLRILILVLFKIPPSSAFHEFIGLLCLIVYVILPLFYISKSHFKCYPIIKRHYFVRIADVSDENPLRYLGLHFSFFIIIVFVSFNIRKMDKITRPTANNIVLSGFKKDILESTVVKFKNAEALIYFKHTPFYAPEHNPMICWTGSGYEFKHIKKETLAGKEIYTALLVKGNDEIYSAWWFDNGKSKTINQFAWRWEALKTGSEYNLINVSASSPQLLEKWAVRMINTNFKQQLSENGGS